MISKAAALLKRFNEADGLDPTVDQPSTNQAVVDAPGDTKASDTQPDDNDTGHPELDTLAQPESMAEALDAQADMCDRYMDADDSDVYTPTTDDEKNAVMEARGMMRRAGGMMRGLKKQ